jgi:predicted transcriptional regulator
VEKIKQELARRINEELDNYDLWITRKQLAKMAGISESTLYLVLKGKATVDYALRVCKVLKIELI